MDGTEHVIIGGLLGLGLGVFLDINFWEYPLFLLLGAFFGIAPDIDIQTSEIRHAEIGSLLVTLVILILSKESSLLGKLFLGIITWSCLTIALSIRGIFTHRGVTHSLIWFCGLALCAGAVAGPQIYLLFVVCWGSHLILDKTKKVNLRVFPPLIKKTLKL